MSIYNKIIETAITFDDVLLVPAYSEILPNQVSLKSRLSDKITLNIPIVSAAMDTVTELDMAIALAKIGGLGFIHKNMSIEAQASQINQVKCYKNTFQYPNSNKDKEGKLVVGAGVGIGIDTMDRTSALVEVGVDIIAVDSAHGHSKGVLDKIKEIRQNFPNLDIVGGNIVTAEAAEDLINAGANILKVGVGPGSICTTRVVAGVGVPQLSAIYNVYEIANKHNIAVIADGGIKLSGDIVKAIASGASAVMLGALLTGTDEATGEEIIFQGRKFKSYQGMGSLSAMQRGGKERYFQSEAKKFVPEGIEGKVPYKGKLEDVVFQLTGGLRAGMGYCGAKDIISLQQDSKMVKITNSGLKESHPHDVIITQQAPNYPL